MTVFPTLCLLPFSAGVSIPVTPSDSSALDNQWALADALTTACQQLFEVTPPSREDEGEETLAGARDNKDTADPVTDENEFSSEDADNYSQITKI